MTRYKLTDADIAKAVEINRQRRSDASEAKRMRREGELALLNKLLSELSMPEWYPHQ